MHLIYLIFEQDKYYDRILCIPVVTRKMDKPYLTLVRNLFYILTLMKGTTLVGQKATC